MYRLQSTVHNFADSKLSPVALQVLGTHIFNAHTKYQLPSTSTSNTTAVQHNLLSSPLHDHGPNHATDPTLRLPWPDPRISVGVVGEDGSPGAVRVERAGAVHGGEAEAAADVERVPLRARVQRRERVAHRLHSRRGQRRALADVQARQAVPVIAATAAPRSVPAPALAPHAAVRGQRVHGAVRDVLAVVQPQGPQVRAAVRQCNHTLIFIQSSKSSNQ